MPITNYLYDGQNVLQEYDDLGSTNAYYTYEPHTYGSLISQHRNGQSSFYHQDALGSTRELTDDTETSTDNYVFSGCGETIEESGTTNNPFRWTGGTGYYWDSESNRYYVRARHYSPALARWLTRDPLLFVDGPNSYTAYFVPSSIDPSGLTESCSVDSFSHEIVDEGVFEFGKNVDIFGFGGGRLNFWVGAISLAKARFDNDTGCCKCCEYKQYVTQTIRFRICLFNQRTKRKKCHPWVVQEDIRHPEHDCGTIERDGKVIKYCHGQKNIPSLKEDYGYSDEGCKLCIFDYPGLYLQSKQIDRILNEKFPGFPGWNNIIEVRASTRLYGQIIDTCNGDQVVAQETVNSTLDTTLSPGFKKTEVDPRKLEKTNC